MPEGRGSAGGICIEGVDAVVHGGYVEHVAYAGSRNVQGMHVERLGIYFAVHRVGIQLAEPVRSNVAGIEDPLVQGRAGAVVLVVPRQNVPLGARRASRQKEGHSQSPIQSDDDSVTASQTEN